MLAARPALAPGPDQRAHVVAARLRGPRPKPLQRQRGRCCGELDAARERQLRQERRGERSVKHRTRAVRVEDLARERRALDDLLAVAADRALRAERDYDRTRAEREDLLERFRQLAARRELGCRAAS